MRDTGCTGVVVRRSLVSDGQMLNKQSGVTLINNYKQRCPVAHINSDCPSLEVLRMHCALRIETKFIRRNGLIYRHFKKNAKVSLQLVVPSSLTHSVMNLAHESRKVVNHVGRKETISRVLDEFYWLCV